MRLAILSSVALSLLLAATGCSVSTRHASTTPAHVASTELASDPSYAPPGEMDVAIGEAKGSSVDTSVATSMPAPNRREIHRGQIHAAY